MPSRRDGFMLSSDGSRSQSFRVRSRSLTWLNDSAKQGFTMSLPIKGWTTRCVRPGDLPMSLFEAERLTEIDTWYVSYRSNITPKRDDGERRFVRATRKFKTEAEAKQFAHEIIKNGWSAIAGTLNPYKPKKTVSSTQILDWIAGKN
jgi:hypothetical protein